MHSLLLQLKTLVTLLLLPPAGLLLLSIAGLLLLKRRPRLARACLIVGVGSLWLLSTPVVSDALSAAVERFPALDLNRAAGAQAIVILGGGGQRAFAPEYGGPSAEPLMLERLSYGAYLAQQTHLPILVTGNGLEAEAMKRTLQRNFGIEVRWVDDQAYDTFENARNSVRQLEASGIDRIILVTHSAHLWRALREFSAAGVQVVPAPVALLADRERPLYRFLPSVGALARACAVLHELLGELLQEFLSATHLRRQ